MKDFSFKTKLGLFTTYLAGIGILIVRIQQVDFTQPWMLLALSLLASLALILKVEGATNRSHYTFSFLVYGFSFALFGVPGAILVIVVSNIVEWIWNRPPWFIQVFNTACYLVAMQIAGILYTLINPVSGLDSWRVILAFAVSMGVFDFLNHLMVGVIVWLARGENFKSSGIFDSFSLMLDLTLLYFGASLYFVWSINQYALLLLLIPIYLIYSTLKIPALQRQTELDPKTNLYNSQYFKLQFKNELARSDRFDRPVSMIMADLDLLRNINNTYGHLAGDEVLISVSKTLKELARNYDVVARLGGEEFGILMPETTLSQAYERAEQIRKAIEEMEVSVSTSVTPIRVTISFGVAAREGFGSSVNDIIHNADTALYHSKLTGRNRVVAYSQNAYLDFTNPKTAEYPAGGPTISDIPARFVQVAESAPKPAGKLDPGPTAKPEPASLPKIRKTGVRVYEFIGLVALISVISFCEVCIWMMPKGILPPGFDWLGVLAICALIFLSEWFSIDLFIRDSSVSTSAIPILVAYLIFGPIGTLLGSLSLAVSLALKHRSPFNRFVFNFSNHLLSGALCMGLLYLFGGDFLRLSTPVQLIVCLVSAGLLFGTTTWMISFGMSLDVGIPASQIWHEQYSWLASFYAGIGLIAYTLTFGYHYDQVVGILLMAIPMILLRISQKQYVDRTREIVTQLREKNLILKKNSEEIAGLIDGLLDMLSNVIDIRDPYVMGHSKRVSAYAVEIAKRMNLNESQIEMIRKGSLLHDVGKLGIPDEILLKPAKLTSTEMSVIKNHPRLGAELLAKNPSLRPLVSIVRNHHEFYNGNGYPDQLRGNQISIEARIVAVADTIEAMSSDRPYRKSMSNDQIIDELRRCSGSQFDPYAAEVAIQMIIPISGAPLHESFSLVSDPVSTIPKNA